MEFFRPSNSLPFFFKHDTESKVDEGKPSERSKVTKLIIEFTSWPGNHISNSDNKQLPNLVLYIKKN